MKIISSNLFIQKNIRKINFTNSVNRHEDIEKYFYQLI